MSIHPINSSTKSITGAETSIDANWWRGGVIYQIYPRSFQDTNNDGIGDLPGIIQRLPYLESLGVDAIWISPFFKSPMQDFGYDVSDYRDVDPMFGTLNDLDNLIDSAHKCGIRIIIDLVVSHTSEQHPWFVESRADKINSKSDWYVWADPKADGTPPNNWLSIFGQSAWQWDARREQYYLHNFLRSQPDLNLHYPDVQNAILDIFRFWCERGIDGFRLDTINFYFADQQLRDNPPLPIQARNATIAPSVNPYNYQDHIYSKNQPENIAFIQRVRKLLNDYPNTITLGEVGDAQRGLEILGDYTEGEDKLHMCYAFELLSAERLTATRLQAVFDKVEEVANNGWACWAFSNHDIVRHISRWQLSDLAARTYTTLMMCLRGTPCIYQGEELGLSEANIAYDDLRDPYGIEFWPEFVGRDGCRTPMVWEDNAANAGFSSSKPWLPINADHAAKSVKQQEHDPSAMLHHYRHAISLRQSRPALRVGEQSRIEVSANVACFTRACEMETIVCVFNLGDTTTEHSLDAAEYVALGAELGCSTTIENYRLTLQPWQPAILVKNKRA